MHRAGCNETLDAQATESFNHPSANSCNFSSSSLYDCPLPDLQLYLEFHVPALLTHGPILTHAFLLLSHLLVSMHCGGPCIWIICCQGLCFSDCTPTAPSIQSIHSSAQNGTINKICQILTFLAFGFCLEKLLLPLVAPSKAGCRLSCVFAVICLWKRMYRVVFFLLSGAPQTEERDKL